MEVTSYSKASSHRSLLHPVIATINRMHIKQKKQDHIIWPKDRNLDRGVQLGKTETEKHSLSKEKTLDRVTEKEPRLYHDWIGKYRILFPSPWAISFKLFIGFSSECWRHDLKILYDPVSIPFQHTQLMHRTPILPVHRKNLFTSRPLTPSYGNPFMPQWEHGGSGYHAGG